MEALYTVIITHIIELLAAFVSVLVLYVIRYTKSRIDAEKRVILQQTMPREKASTKLEAAIWTASQVLRERGKPVDTEMIHVTIEAELKRLKRDFGDACKENPP